MHFASLREVGLAKAQRRKEHKDKVCEKYSTTNLFCEVVLVTDSHIVFYKRMSSKQIRLSKKTALFYK